jgi:hypothetical protein
VKDSPPEELLALSLPYLEQLLALQGDHAEPELIALQQELATRLKPQDRG